MGVGAGLYMYNVVVKKFTFAISSPDEFVVEYQFVIIHGALFEVLMLTKSCHLHIVNMLFVYCIDWLNLIPVCDLIDHRAVWTLVVSVTVCVVVSTESSADMPSASSVTPSSRMNDLYVYTVHIQQKRVTCSIVLLKNNSWLLCLLSCTVTYQLAKKL